MFARKIVSLATIGDVELVLMAAPYWWWPFHSRPLPKNEQGMFLVKPEEPFAVSMRWRQGAHYVISHQLIEFHYDKVMPCLTSGHNRWVVLVSVQPNTEIGFVLTLGVMGQEAMKIHGAIRVV